MKDKEKQIKEMEIVMAVNWFNETILGTAERLYDAGFRKLPEDSKDGVVKFANFIKSKLFDLGNIVNESDIDDMLKEYLQ